ncbi:MAG TPA: signal peptidase II [Longimicrobiales bacterium]|nr:signal peptidase II [Longimicrobiales bacterium]
MPNPKLIIAGPTVVTIILLDVITKQWALRALADGESISLIAGLVPLTLAFNTGAAFSLNVGIASRWVFMVLSIVALVVLGILYRQAQPNDRLRVVSLSVVAAGAMGNLIDRIRWDRGVVDFIGPIDLGFMYWPIFNVADMAITTGAALLMLSLWLEERAHRSARDAVTSPHPATDPDNT